MPQARAASSAMPTAVSINLIDPIGAQRRATGVPELDRVLDGGLVPGSVTLLVGEPGMGKSTLMLQALGRMAADGARCLLVSAEESCEQVRMRADRLGVLEPSLLVVSDTSLHNVLAQVDAVAPDVLAIDSIQTVHDPDLPGSPGSVTQVRECAQRLVRLAKERGISVVLVGHVTKDGQLAGPRALEHVVDTVLQFEGDRHHALRMLRALKHRFGSTHELGLFEMGEAGLIDVPDPSALFLTDRRPGLPGSIVAPVLEGARPLLVEVQALVNSSTAPMPRRSAQGLESSRLAMLLAVLDARAGVSVADVDVYASVAGGVRVIEAGADLAVAIAVASARIGVAVPDDLVAIGEIGLGGELRQAGQTPRRLAEAARLGFRRAIVPASSAGVEGIELIRVGSVVEALAAVGLSLDQQRAPS
ncbi:DNA repair protein RadA [Actinobacteria bacterium IMCC26256]|nr:DNA repair protein RadA [Actinobacteria bacterium IMCC26256]